MRKRSWRNIGRTHVDTTTCAPSEHTTSRPSTCSVEASLAKTCHSLAEVLASRVRAAVFGSSTSELLANYDPASSSWRTSRRSLLGEPPPYSGAWPRSGTVQSGRLYAHPTLALRTDENGSSSWPTPTAHDRKGTCPSQAKRRSLMLRDLVERIPAWIPREEEFYCTTHRTMAFDCSCPPIEDWTRDPYAQSAAPLNPEWVETLMGFPQGWTDLGPPAAVQTNTSGSPRARRTR